jgi:hypothetical protein
MKRSFEFEFEDQSSENTISFEYDEQVDENFNVLIENDVCVMYANREAFLALAKVFVRIALSNYPEGFHVHLRKNFDADEPDILSITLCN